LRAQDCGQSGNAFKEITLSLRPQPSGIRNRYDARRPCASARYRDMQPKAHCVENLQNRREVGLYWTCKGTMKARPRKPRFLRKVRDVVQMDGGAYGVTNFDHIRLLKRLI
jgi:hypothetical protein